MPTSRVNGAVHRGHVVRAGSPDGTARRITAPRSPRPATRPASAPATVQARFIVRQSLRVEKVDSPYAGSDVCAGWIAPCRPFGGHVIRPGRTVGRPAGPVVSSPIGAPSSCQTAVPGPGSRYPHSGPYHSRRGPMSKLFVSLHHTLAARLRSDRGASAVEYGLLVALIAAVIVAIVALVGQHVASAFSTVNNSM